MEDAKVDGQLQITAALTLLDKSLLVKWSASEMAFTSIRRETFDKSWRQIHPAFGEDDVLDAFLAGAELLAKGACLYGGVDFRREQQVPKYPDGQLHDWSRAFLSNPASNGSMLVANYGTLGNLVYPSNNQPALLRRLCNSIGVSSADADLLVAAYTLLAKSIRNRDAHAYVPHVRDQHLSLVPELFVDCFNLLIAPMRQGTNPISRWKDDAELLVQVLQWPTEEAYDDEKLAGLRERAKFFRKQTEIEKGTLGLTVTNNGIKGINELTALKELDLSSSYLTDDCITELLALKRLEIIGIYRGKITDSGLMRLTRIRSLKKLQVRQGYTNITDAGIRQFKQRRPDVQVTW